MTSSAKTRSLVLTCSLQAPAPARKPKRFEMMQPCPPNLHVVSLPWMGARAWMGAHRLEVSMLVCELGLFSILQARTQPRRPGPRISTPALFEHTPAQSFPTLGERCARPPAPQINMPAWVFHATATRRRRRGKWAGQSWGSRGGTSAAGRMKGGRCLSLRVHDERQREKRVPFVADARRGVVKEAEVVVASHGYLTEGAGKVD